MSGDTETTIEAMREAASALRSVSCSELDEVRAIRTAINALAAAEAERLAVIDEAKLHESEGASSVATWARRETGTDAGVTRRRVRAGATFKELPSVAEAAKAGRLTEQHVDSFTYALKHVGAEQTRLLEQPLLELAVTLSPIEFHAKVRAVRDRLHPDDLDAAWLAGMDKHDIRLAKTGEGWHVTGFLDIETGAMLNEILTNLSVPRDADDTRSPSQRRLDGLHELCQTTLESGLPADNGIRPHLNVIVDADTLQNTINDTTGAETLDTELEPATLEGFGPIGPGLLSYLLCGAELTPFLVKSITTNPEILDVGRIHRLATPRQAKAIRMRQSGICASPGCRHKIAHVHHVVYWSDGGPTHLDTMIGLCRKCHTLVHADQLVITGTHSTGFQFTSPRGQPLARTG